MRPVSVQRSILHKNPVILGTLPPQACDQRVGRDYTVDIREEHQQNPVADHVSALVAVTRPIIAGVLRSIPNESLAAIGKERDDIPLHLVASLRTQGDGDCGVAFEYAVHNAVVEGDSVAIERVSDALRQCRITRGEPASILFAIEKAGAQQLISTELDLITPESRVLSGTRGQPVKLKNHMTSLARAFRSPRAQLNLPQSIRGLWKADLFLGSATPDHWVGTSVKINPDRLEAARGLRIAIVPSLSGRADSIRKDDQKNLVICPMPYDGSFMEVFFEGWQIVQALCERRFRMPRDVELPNSLHRTVADMYVARREFPVRDVLAAMRIFAQPELLVTEDETVSSTSYRAGTRPGTSTVVGPFARQL